MKKVYCSLKKRNVNIERKSIPVRLIEDSNSTAPGRYDCSHNDFMCDHGDDRCALKKEIKSSIF